VRVIPSGSGKVGLKRGHPLPQVRQRVPRVFDSAGAELVSGVDSIKLLVGARHDGVGPGGGSGCGGDVGAEIFPWTGQISFGSDTIGFSSNAVPRELHVTASGLGDLKFNVGRTAGTRATRTA